MKTYAAYIVVVLCALAVGALILYAPRSAVITAQGRIDPRGDFVTSDGKTFVIANLRNLGNDWKDGEVEVTGYVRRQGRIPAEVLRSTGFTDRDSIEVSSYHVIGSSTWWDNCVASCKPRELSPTML